ncbi:aquaporin Z [Candidatus Saccharibacteria bacterium]|nr:aquaporin Z [Candidatus Saccharibacteria bacterium]
MKQYRDLMAELFGTMLLVLGGCGTAILAGPKIGVLGVALAFGLSLLVIAYAIGHISGGHVNPAVTIALAMTGKFDRAKVAGYIMAQIIGGLLGGAILLYIASQTPGFTLEAKTFAVNGYGALSPSGASLGAAFVIEIVMTAVLLFAVMATTHKKFPAGFGGLTVGMSLALIHMISIPVTNTSVNPARSIAVALFAGGDAVTQLWLFIIAPVIGALVGAYLYKFIAED